MALRRESCAAAAARSSVFGAPPPGKGGALAAELSGGILTAFISLQGCVR